MSLRHTKSMSELSYDSIDRPSGYGPRATIPDNGFVERILRQERRQDKRLTTVDGVHSRYMEYNFVEPLEDINSGPHDHSIEPSLLLEGITESNVRITLNDMVSQQTNHSPPRMTCKPDHTPNRYATDERVLSPSMVMLQTLLAAEEDKISRQQAASFFSSPAAPSSISSRSTAPRIASSGVGANQSNTSMPGIRNMRTPMQGFTEDSDTDSDNSDGEITRLDSFGEEPVIDIEIRTPKSTESFATVYVQSIRDVLLEYLSSFHIPYFMALVILTTGISTDPEIPVVVIVYQGGSFPDNRFSSIDDLPAAVQTSGYSVLFCEGTFHWLASSMSNSYRHLHESLVSGISIEGKEEGTVGLFVEAEDNTFYGFSCGHVLGRVGNHVLQPSLHDFHNYTKTLDRAVRNLEQEIKETRNDVTKFVRQNTLETIRQQLDIYKKHHGEDDCATKKLLCIGRTIESENAVIEYQGRTCYSDWAVFVCDRHRLPGGEAPLDLNTPDHGVLSTADWRRMNGFAPIKWDTYIRKAGRTTGMTFGFVAGIYGNWVPDTFPDKTCEEFYALEEKTADNQFAAQGDSGAAVIDDDGKIIGFVFAGIKINTVKFVFDRTTRRPDILKINERRETHGLEDVYSEYISNRNFVLIESANMVVERTTIRGEIVRDC